MTRRIAWVFALVLVVSGFWANLECGGREGNRLAGRVTRFPLADRGAKRSESALLAPITPARKPVPVQPRVDPVAEEDPLDAPTPERPGQALLRVEVVSLDTGEALAGLHLWLWCEGDDELATSEQNDPARGVEGDDVHTDAAGRAEFVVVAGRAYGIASYDGTGKADTREFEPELEPLAEGEECSVRFALPTAWRREWHGRAVDGETGLPLAGAEAVALAPHSAETLDALVVLGRGRTDGDGHVSFRLPGWESVVVRFESAGYSWKGCWAHEEADAPERADEIAMHRSASLGVTVLDVDGSPAPGLDVRLNLQSFWLIEASVRQDLEWTATTDECGRCAFTALPSLVPFSMRVLRGERTLLLPFSETRGVELEPDEHRLLVVRLEPGIGIVGKVVDGGGHPLANVPLFLCEGPAYMATSVLARPDATHLSVLRSSDVARFGSTRSDGEGRFSFDRVPVGVWAVGPDTEEASDFPSVLLYFRLQPDATHREIELSLDRGLMIRGTVLDPEGTPARACLVTCSVLEQMPRHEYTERDGSFIFGPLPAGSSVLSAGGGEDPTVAGSERVEVAAGTTDVVLYQRWGGALLGRVVNARGESVEAAVQLVERLFSHTDEGSFSFTNLAAGQYDVVATTEDEIGLVTAPFVRPRCVIDDLVITLEPGARLTVRMVGPELQPHRVEVIGQELVLARWFQNEDFTRELVVPPSEVRVVFSRWADGRWETMRDERVSADAGQELEVAYQVPH